MDIYWTGKNKEIVEKAFLVGCKPMWYDGMFGWMWHCGCDDHKHACDQQCSILTMESLERKQL